jgi:hypothetical protein
MLRPLKWFLHAVKELLLAQLRPRTAVPGSIPGELSINDTAPFSHTQRPQQACFDVDPVSNSVAGRIEVACRCRRLAPAKDLKHADRLNAELHSRSRGDGRTHLEPIQCRWTPQGG